MILNSSDDFEILEDEVIARGEKGTIYRGRQRSRGRDVVIRVVRDASASDPVFVEKFHDEAELLSRLEERSLVQLYGTGLWKGRLFYAMEPVRGEDLGSCLAQAHRFTTDEILHIAEGVACALRAAWRCKLVHCDIKPANIFLGHDGSVKVVDFALRRDAAEPVDEDFVPRRWRYASPEETLGGQADIRSDIYALGVVLYELAAGKPPFDGYDSATSLLYQLMHVSPSSPREAGATIPKELDRLILRCLAKNPEDRYQDPEEFLRDLNAVRETLSRPALPTAVEEDSGDFDIHEDQILGEGGMGTLYRGRQRTLGRPVAIKVIREIFTASPDFVQRFRREAELLAQVNDPSVVQVFGTGTWKGRLYYAMELVEGQDVASQLKDKVRFTPSEILHVAEGVAQALRAAWRYRIVHRDIKPSNILLTPDGAVKVADFGLAKSLRIPQGESHMIAGTSDYISPEQGIGMAVDIRSDIYSLGVVLYELLAGRPPFKSTGTFTHVVYQHVHVVPPSLEKASPNAPKPLVALIERCLAKRPKNRFQTPDDLLKEIRDVRSRLGERSAAAPAAPGAVRRLWRRVRPESTALSVALLGLIILAGAIRPIAALRRAAPPSEETRRRSYDLALALGADEEAMRVAERTWGKTSGEYLEAQRRALDAQGREIEARARDRVQARDWSGAAQAYGTLVNEARSPRIDEFRTALALCQDFLKAKELEKEGKFKEAIEIYHKYATLELPMKDYVVDTLRRLKGAPLLNQK